MSEESKTLEQRKADLSDRKAALDQIKKELDEKTKVDNIKKYKFYMIGIGAAVSCFILMSISFILGMIIVAVGVGVIFYLNKKGKISFKSNNEELEKLIKEESEGIAADEAAILEDEEAERKRKEEEDRKRKEAELELERNQIEAEENGVYGSCYDFSEKSLIERKSNLIKIENYFLVDNSLGVEQKVDLINSAKESINDLVSSTCVNDIIDELDNIAVLLNVDEKLVFTMKVTNIRTALANLAKAEDLLGAEINQFDSNEKSLNQRVTRITDLQKKYNIDASLSVEEQVSNIKAAIREEEHRRQEEEERRRKAAELRQKAVQIQKEIDVIYGVVESKFGYVSKLLLEGKMKKIEEFERFFGVDSSLNIDEKIVIMKTSCEKIKTLGFNETTIAKLKSAFVKHAESLGVSSNLPFEDMLTDVKNASNK